MAKLKCSLCDEKSVYKSENGYLCKKHFLKYFENKFYKTVRNYKIIKNDDVIVVGYSGGKDSTTMLYLLNKYCKQRNIKLFAILIDEGIADYRDKLINYATNFCKTHEIELHIFSYEKELGFSLDQAIKANKDQKPCSVCGILRRYLLNTKSRKLGATKLAIGHNLDDETQTLFLNIMQNKPELIARSGIDSGVLKETKFVKRIKPLFFLKEKEIMLFSILRQFQTDFSECPYAQESMRFHIRKYLNQVANIYPHMKSNVINADLVIVDALKQYYFDLNTHKMKDDSLNIEYCDSCGEPASNKQCNACKVILAIKSKLKQIGD